MPYASCLAPVVWPCSLMSSVVLRQSSACPQAFSLLELCLSLGILLIGALLVQGFGVLLSLLSRVFCIAPWHSLSGLCASWDSLSGFLSL